MANILRPDTLVDIDPITAKYIGRWLKSPIYWFKDCVYTIDEARANLKLDAIRRFPIDEVYVRLLLYYADVEPIIWVNKSRRMMATWTFTTRLLYKTLWSENCGNYIISRSMTEADDLLKERCWFVYDNIPTEHWDEEYQQYVNLKAMHPQAYRKRGILEVPEMRSFIKAVAAGPGKIRGKTGSNIFWDEIATQEKILETWEALGYVIKGGGHIQGVTTPEDNDFKSLYFGLSSAENTMVL